jgi:predicted nucleic acid binding AN1-type Zn finger protein
MDFAHVGSHCEADYCHQQDFLPFKCACSKTFCLQHRSPASHSCSAIGANDVTSLECPVCRKSVLMARIDDPGFVLERHYAMACTKVIKPKPVQLCAAVGCASKLGPGTTMTCKSCGNATCISHRFSSHHNCVRMNKSRLSAPTSSDKAVPAKKPQSYSTAVAAPSTELSVAPSVSEDHEICPQCSRRFTDVMSLITHVELDHSRVAGIVR